MSNSETEIDYHGIFKPGDEEFLGTSHANGNPEHGRTSYCPFCREHLPVSVKNGRGLVVHGEALHPSDFDYAQLAIN